jgi:hypothetical protein
VARADRDGEVEVRSLNGEKGRWYRELMANPDAESVERADARVNEKYAGSPYLDTMVRDEIAPTTVRLEPR